MYDLSWDNDYLVAVAARVMRDRSQRLGVDRVSQDRNKFARVMTRLLRRHQRRKRWVRGQQLLHPGFAAQLALLDEPLSSCTACATRASASNAPPNIISAPSK